MLRFPSAEGVCGLFEGHAAAEGETVASPAGIPRVSPIFAASEVHERDDDLGLLTIMPSLVTGKADSRMKTNATTVRCGDESSSREGHRVRIQRLEGNIERAKVKRTIVTVATSAFAIPYHSRCILLEPQELCHICRNTCETAH